MRTVKWLKKELSKFPDDAVCHAYEGEVTGIVIQHAGMPITEQGMIYCSERDDEDKQTELLKSVYLQRQLGGGQ